MGTNFVHITPIIHQNCEKSSHIFGPNVYALAFFCIYVAKPMQLFAKVIS